MNFFGIGGFELLVIGLVAFLVLGPRRMAEAGKTVAKIMSELRKQRDELTSAILDEPEQGQGRREAGSQQPGTRPLAPGRAAQERPVPEPPPPEQPVPGRPSAGDAPGGKAER